MAAPGAAIELRRVGGGTAGLLVLFFLFTLCAIRFAIFYINKGGEKWKE
jgi:hypothetical protein